MPAKFDFRFQPLLDWRKRIAEEKQRDFAVARQALDDCRDELERLGNTRWRSAEKLAAMATRCPADLRLLDAHLRSVDAAIAQGRRRLSALQAAWERAREELVVASRDRRALERYRERRLRAFEAEKARREELELDESNARSHERALRERLPQRQTESAAR